MKNYNILRVFKAYKDFWITLKFKNKIFVIGLLFAGVLGSLLELFSIVIITPLISSLSGESIKNELILGILNQIDNLYLGFKIEPPSILSTVISVIILKNIFWIFYINRVYKFSYQFEIKLSQKIFDSFISSNYLNYVNYKTSNFIADSTFEARKINLNFIIPSFIIFSEVFVLLILIYFVISISSTYSIVSVIVIGLIMYIFHSITGKKIKTLSNKRLIFENKRIDFIKHTYDSFKEIKLRELESSYSKKFNEFNKFISDSESKFTQIQQTPRYIYEIVLYSFIVIILNFKSYFFDHTSVLVGLGIFVVSLIRIIPSITKITSNYQSLLYSLASIKRFKISNPVITESKKIRITNSFKSFESLKIRGLTFSFDKDKNLLNNINFDILRGEYIGIHGTSGSGKSTMLHIISGLIDTYNGKIYVNNTQNINLKNEVSYCHQDTVIINGTLAENISFNLDEKINFTRVESIIDQVELKVFVNSLAEGINTIISENGSNLSGGQKQRIGLARALYRGASILLLDEFTSALDKKTESNILKNLLNLKSKGLTLIMVSHKSEPLKVCDKVLYINDGKIKES